MNVLAAAVGLHQQLVSGEMRQQPQLDLRIIGREQHVARLGDECGANLAAKFGADGNILQIGIGGRQPPGRRSRLLKVVCSRPVSGFSSAGSAST